MKYFNICISKHVNIIQFCDIQLFSCGIRRLQCLRKLFICLTYVGVLQIQYTYYSTLFLLHLYAKLIKHEMNYFVLVWSITICTHHVSGKMIYNLNDILDWNNLWFFIRSYYRWILEGKTEYTPTFNELLKWKIKELGQKCKWRD